MKIGQWRERILIQKNNITKDKTGNQKNVWVDYYSCHAYVNNLSGREYWEAAQVNQEASLYFIVRYCRELESMDSTLYRIMFKGEVYNITFVDFMQYQMKTIKLRAEKGKR